MKKLSLLILTAILMFSIRGYSEQCAAESINALTGPNKWIALEKLILEKKEFSIDDMNGTIFTATGKTTAMVQAADELAVKKSWGIDAKKGTLTIQGYKGKYSSFIIICKDGFLRIIAYKWKNFVTKDDYSGSDYDKDYLIMGVSL